MKALFLALFMAIPVAAAADSYSQAYVCTVDGQYVGRSAGVMGCFTPAGGGGGVTGPGSSTAHNLASFADSSGGVLEDSGVLNSNLCLLTGNQTVAGVKTISSAPILSALTASKPIFTDGSKALTSSGTVPIAQGGTNSTTSLSNNRVMQSSGGAIVEAAAITASKGLCSDANGIPVACTSGPSATEMTYLAGVTSALQMQLNLKAPLASPTFTGSITTPLTAHGAVISNGSTVLATVAPGTNGNVLTSNGTDWTSAAAAGGVATWGSITGASAQAAPAGGWTGESFFPAGSSGTPSVQIGMGQSFPANFWYDTVNLALEVQVGGGTTAITYAGNPGINASAGGDLILSATNGNVTLSPSSGKTWGGGGAIVYGAAQGVIINKYIASNADNDGCVGCDFSGTETGNRFAKFVAGTYMVTPQTKHTATQTTLTGTIGTAKCSEPEIGASYKKVVCYLSAYTATAQGYTFPTAFVNAPYVYGVAAGVSGATAITSSITFTTSAVTGFVFAEGY